MTRSAQRLIMGTTRKEAMTTLNPEIAMSQEPEMPRVKPSPPMAMLNPPPMSVAAVDEVVWNRFMLRSAARKVSLSLSPRFDCITRNPIHNRTRK